MMSDAEPITHLTDLAERDEYLRMVIPLANPHWRAGEPIINEPEFWEATTTPLKVSNFRNIDCWHMHIEDFNRHYWRSMDMADVPTWLNFYKLSKTMVRILRFGWTQFTEVHNIKMDQGGWLRIEDVAYMCARKMKHFIDPRWLVAVGKAAAQKSRPTDKNRFQFAWNDDNYDRDEEGALTGPIKTDANTAFPYVAIRAVQGHFVEDISDKRLFVSLDDTETLASHLKPLIHGTLLSRVPQILKHGLVPAGGGVSAYSSAT